MYNGGKLEMSGFKFVVDSCCEITEEMAGNLEVEFVPFSLTVDDEVFVDSMDFDVKAFINAMENSSSGAKSGCPTPFDFEQKIDPEKETFVITITAGLSACYESACMARQNVLENHPDAKIHVFNTKSAAAGEALVFLKIKDCIQGGKSFEEIIEIVEDYIKDLQTLFVLGKLDNMVKNGRMSKIAGTVVSLMSIHPILMGDREGEIGIKEKCIGRKKALSKLVESVGNMGVPTCGKRAFVSYCNNPERGMDIKARLEKMYDFSEVLIAPTRGLGTMYAEDGGIIISF